MPKKPLRTRTQSFAHRIRRNRTPVVVIAAIVLFIYWISHRSSDYDPTDWSRFAYVQYATDPQSMCNAYMVFEALKRLGSKADRVLLYPNTWDAARNDPKDRTSQLLFRAKKTYGAKLKPIQLLGLDGPAEAGTLKKLSTWETSITKLRVFEVDEYERVLYFDNDVHVQQHMDELFLLPSAPIALPRAYWSDRSRDEWRLSSVLMLVEPNPAETKHMWERLQGWRFDPNRNPSFTYDDDLINDRFGSSAMVLPHRPYVLQTSEFRRPMSEHQYYLGTVNAPPSARPWDPHTAIKEAKLVHFQDWPLPKPWIMWPNDGLVEMQPACTGSHTGSCADREVW